MTMDTAQVLSILYLRKYFSSPFSPGIILPEIEELSVCVWCTGMEQCQMSVMVMSTVPGNKICANVLF
jgi:hypothetical protein